MSSIVLELQQDILNANCDLLSVLRKAHLIASKLHLEEFDIWIMSELNGYSNYNDIPDYRKVSGALKAWNPYHGWISVVLSDNKTEELLCTRKLDDSLGDLINLENKSKSAFIIRYSAEICKTIDSICTSPFPTEYSLHVSTHKLKSIIEKVKNTILEWTIKLEAEGILGEGLEFNPAERETAKRIPQTINNYYGNTNVINAPVDHSAVVAGDDASVTFTYEKAQELASDIETALKTEDISSEDQETAIEMLTEIKEKICEQKRPNIIKAALVGLKDFLIGIGASATVALIQAKMQGLF